MSRVQDFKPVAAIQHAKTEDDFLAAIRMCDGNAYLESSAPLREKRPLMYSFSKKALSRGEVKAPFEYFYVQDSNGLITANATTRRKIYNDETISLVEISVRPEHRNKKLATALLHALMNYAMSEQKILRIGIFEDGGAKYLARTIPQIHGLFPELRIKFGIPDNVSIYGSQRYSLKETVGRPAVIFE
jgi:GNAT superfamily N-acetyltransferase